MKKIAFIYDTIYPYQLGGTEKRIYSLAQYAKKDFEVHIIGMRKNGIKKDFIKNGVYYHALNQYNDLYNDKGKRKILLSIQFAISLFFFLLKNNYDIIDATSNPYFHIFSIKLISIIKRKTKIFITWHEYWNLNYWIEYSSLLIGTVGYILERIALLFSNNLITVSNYTKRKIEDIIKKEVYLIPNGIDLKKTERGNKIYDLVYTGRIIDFKNIDKILDLANLNKELKILIIGDGPELERYKNKYRTKNIKFTGFLKKDSDVLKYLAQSKIFMMLSSREGFSISTLEAMSIGLPVICFKGENNAAVDLIDNHKNGILTDLNIKNINKHILAILNNYKFYSLNAKRSSNQFLYKNIYKEYIKLISSL